MHASNPIQSIHPTRITYIYRPLALLYHSFVLNNLSIRRYVI